MDLISVSQSVVCRPQGAHGYTNEWHYCKDPIRVWMYSKCVYLFECNLWAVWLVYKKYSATSSTRLIDNKWWANKKILCYCSRCPAPLPSLLPPPPSSPSHVAVVYHTAIAAKQWQVKLKSGKQGTRQQNEVDTVSLLYDEVVLCELTPVLCLSLVSVARSDEKHFCSTKSPSRFCVQTHDKHIQLTGKRWSDGGFTELLSF